MSMTTAELGAIFDFDGVVIDSSAQHEKSWELLAAENDLPLPEGHFKKGFGKRNETIIPGILGWSEDPGEIRRLSYRKEELYRQCVREDGVEMLPGARELLRELRAAGVPCVVGSSTHRENIETALDALEARRFFEGIISGEDVTEGKPHPEVFLKCAELIERQPDSCVVFEDSYAGMEAGLAGGMKVVGVATTHAEAEVNAHGQPTATVHRLTAVDLAFLLALWH
jgi:HAD superfamily hydrolase (TIGR01509 family)